MTSFLYFISLHSKPEGSFLIRDATNGNGNEFTLVVRFDVWARHHSPSSLSSNGIAHLPIEASSLGLYQVAGKPPSAAALFFFPYIRMFNSLSAVIEFHFKNPLKVGVCIFVFY